jgi:hypothetical protein
MKQLFVSLWSSSILDERMFGGGFPLADEVLGDCLHDLIIFMMRGFFLVPDDVFESLFITSSND